MDSIADALVYATTYINLWDDQDEKYHDEDVGALESISAILIRATEEEKTHSRLRQSVPQNVF